MYKTVVKKVLYSDDLKGVLIREEGKEGLTFISKDKLMRILKERKGEITNLEYSKGILKGMSSIQKSTIITSNKKVLLEAIELFSNQVNGQIRGAWEETELVCKRVPKVNVIVTPEWVDELWMTRLFVTRVPRGTADGYFLEWLNKVINFYLSKERVYRAKNIKVENGVASVELGIVILPTK